MHQLAGGRAAVEEAWVGLFQNDHAGALDARVVGIDRRGDEVGEAHVGDKAAALVHLQHRLFARLPIRNLDLAAQNTGLDAYVGDRFGQAECAAPWLAVFARLRRSAAAHVVSALFIGAALMNRRKRQESRQAAGGRAGIHPCQLERR